MRHPALAASQSDLQNVIIQTFHPASIGAFQLWNVEILAFYICACSLECHNTNIPPCIHWSGCQKYISASHSTSHRRDVKIFTSSHPPFIQNWACEKSVILANICAPRVKILAFLKSHVGRHEGVFLALNCQVANDSLEFRMRKSWFPYMLC